jgi:N-ethylmaleimide reductase
MLFNTFTARNLKLKNRIVMSPMTRSRAVKGNTPNELMALYYEQRANAGLIITEGTSPSPNGLGYARIPGIFNQAQIDGWKLVTDAVHSKGGKIVLQLMHTGRVTHISNLPKGAKVLAPTEQVCPGEMYSDTEGMQAHSQPQAMSESDIKMAITEYAEAAKNAISAGFDGVEIHAANGYLIEQFLNANVNTRKDTYGGSNSARNKFLLEILDEVTQAIGPEKVGIRLSPYGAFNSTGEFPEVQAQYMELVEKISKLGLLYLHVLDHSAMGAPSVPKEFKQKMRKAFDGPFILAGGFEKESADKALNGEEADLIGFGRPFISNPDLVERMKNNVELTTPDMDTFYTADAKGYTDYPTKI